MRTVLAKTALAILVCGIVGFTIMLLLNVVFVLDELPQPLIWGLLATVGIGTGIAVHLVRKWNGSHDA